MSEKLFLGKCEEPKEHKPFFQAGEEIFEIIGLEASEYKDKMGCPSTYVKVKNKDGVEHKVLFFFSIDEKVCKSAFRLSGFKKVLGLPYEKIISEEMIKGKKFKMYVGEVYIYEDDALTEPTIKEDGSQLIFTNVLDSFFFGEKEVISESHIAKYCQPTKQKTNKTTSTKKLAAPIEEGNTADLKEEDKEPDF